MKIICGLGNPGKKYEKTRHNMGYLAIDLLAENYGLAFRDKKFPARTAELKLSEETIVLLKSKTYMNDSGIAVGGAAGFYKVDASDCLVVQDDIDLPFGKFRFRREGGAGGHRGIQSISTHLHSTAFHRLKIGVANEFQKDAAEFVLQKFTAEELNAIPAILANAVQAMELWAKQGLEAAMREHN